MLQSLHCTLYIFQIACFTILLCIFLSTLIFYFILFNIYFNILFISLSIFVFYSFHCLFLYFIYFFIFMPCFHSCCISISTLHGALEQKQCKQCIQNLNLTLIGWDPARDCLWQPTGFLEVKRSHLSKTCPSGFRFSQCRCLPSIYGAHFLCVWTSVVRSEKLDYDFSWTTHVPQEWQKSHCTKDMCWEQYVCLYVYMHVCKSSPQWRPFS